MSTHSPACRADSTIQVLFVLMHWKKGTLVLVCEGKERVARYDTLEKTHRIHELTLFEADASVKRTLAFERNVDHVVSSFCFHTTKSGCTVCAPAWGSVLPDSFALDTLGKGSEEPLCTGGGLIQHVDVVARDGTAHIT